MDIAIIAASEDDIPLLAELDKAIYLPADAFSEKDFMDPDYKNFLLFLDEDPIGSTVLAPHKTIAESYSAPLPSAEGTLYIISTAILPQFQRSGFGSIVKAWQIAYARRNNFQRIVTNTRVSNRGSIALNQKFKFRITRVITNYYSDPSEDAFALELDI